MPVSRRPLDLNLTLDLALADFYQAELANDSYRMQQSFTEITSVAQELATTDQSTFWIYNDDIDNAEGRFLAATGQCGQATQRLWAPYQDEKLAAAYPTALVWAHRCLRATNDGENAAHFAILSAAFVNAQALPPIWRARIWAALAWSIAHYSAAMIPVLGTLDLPFGYYTEPTTTVLYPPPLEIPAPRPTKPSVGDSRYAITQFKPSQDTVPGTDESATPDESAESRQVFNAVLALRIATTLDPTNGDYWMELAVQYLSAQLPDLAAESLETAFSLPLVSHPLDELWTLRGHLAARANDTGFADYAYRVAARYNTDAWGFVVSNQFSGHHFEASAAAFIEAESERQPTQSLHAFFLESALEQMSYLPDQNQVPIIARRMLALRPTNPTLQLLTAIVERQSARSIDTAQAAFARFEAVWPTLRELPTGVSLHIKERCQQYLALATLLVAAKKTAPADTLLDALGVFINAQTEWTAELAPFRTQMQLLRALAHNDAAAARELITQAGVPSGDDIIDPHDVDQATLVRVYSQIIDGLAKQLHYVEAATARQQALPYLDAEHQQSLDVFFFNRIIRAPEFVRPADPGKVLPVAYAVRVVAPDDYIHQYLAARIRRIADNVTPDFETAFADFHAIHFASVPPALAVAFTLERIEQHFFLGKALTEREYGDEARDRGMKELEIALDLALHFVPPPDWRNDSHTASDVLDIKAVVVWVHYHLGKATEMLRYYESCIATGNALRTEFATLQSTLAKRISPADANIYDLEGKDVSLVNALAWSHLHIAKPKIQSLTPAEQKIGYQYFLQHIAPLVAELEKKVYLETTAHGDALRHPDTPAYWDDAHFLLYAYYRNLADYDDQLASETEAQQPLFPPLPTTPGNEAGKNRSMMWRDKARVAIDGVILPAWRAEVLRGKGWIELGARNYDQAIQFAEEALSAERKPVYRTSIRRIIIYSLRQKLRTGLTLARPEVRRDTWLRMLAVCVDNVLQGHNDKDMLMLRMAVNDFNQIAAPVWNSDPTFCAIVNALREKLTTLGKNSVDLLIADKQCI